MKISFSVLALFISISTFAQCNYKENGYNQTLGGTFVNLVPQLIYDNSNATDTTSLSVSLSKVVLNEKFVHKNLHLVIILKEGGCVPKNSTLRIDLDSNKTIRLNNISQQCPGLATNYEAERNLTGLSYNMTYSLTNEMIDLLSKYDIKKIDLLAVNFKANIKFASKAYFINGLKCIE